MISLSAIYGGAAYAAEDDRQGGEVAEPVPATDGAVTPMREGDIYFWRYRDGYDRDQFTYWCKSQKAIVRNGLLLDTYWCDMSSERAINLDRVELTYKGNESDLKKINEWEVDYYEPEDIVDMRHPNSPRDFIYVKPTAKRSQARMREYLHYQREREESKVSSALHRITRIDEALALVDAGQLDGYFP